MAAMQEEADVLLIKLAQRTGGIEPLLHSVFSFLKRKTDFYHIQQKGDRIGFPPGKAKKLVLEAYERFDSDLVAPAPPKADLEHRGERLLPDGRRADKPDARPANPPSAPTAAPKPTPSASSTPPSKQDAPGGSTKETASLEGSGGKGVQSGVQSGSAVGGASKIDPRSMFVPYNGGDCGKYKWSQTLEEIVMFIDCLPQDGASLSSKELVVEVKRKSLRVALKKGGAVVEGDLYGDTKEEEVMWHLENGRYLTVTMEKRKQTWWKSALVGDAEIDTQKVDSTCKLEDYDEGTQAAIRKIMFDQNQKMQGLPTSEEMAQHDMLRKAWDAEGSPFKGTPFDPSSINFSGAGGGLPPDLAPP